MSDLWNWTIELHPVRVVPLWLVLHAIWDVWLFPLITDRWKPEAA